MPRIPDSSSQSGTVSIVHPDLANLEQFYVRTRADVTAGRLQGHEGISRVQSNTVVDAGGRVWMVDPMSPDAQRASFKVVAPGQSPAPADPSQYQPAGDGFSQSFGGGFSNAYPAQSMPTEPTDKKKLKLRRDKSPAAIKPAGGLLGRAKALPRWVWLAGAGAVVLLLVSMRMLSGGAVAPASPADLPVTVPTTIAAQPGDSTVPGGDVTSQPVTTLAQGQTSTPVVTAAPALPAVLTAGLVSELITSVESLEIGRAQTVVAEPLDQVAYATFIAKHQAGERLTVIGDPMEFTGSPAASITIQRTSAQGAQISTFAALLVRDEATQSWRFRELPAL
jgi:hypothetical protein